MLACTYCKYLAKNDRGLKTHQRANLACKIKRSFKERQEAGLVFSTSANTSIVKVANALLASVDQKVEIVWDICWFPSWIAMLIRKFGHQRFDGHTPVLERGGPQFEATEKLREEFQRAWGNRDRQNTLQLEYIFKKKEIRKHNAAIKNRETLIP